MQGIESLEEPRRQMGKWDNSVITKVGDQYYA